MPRQNRGQSQCRPLRFTLKYLKHSLGSVLVEWGDTKVLCSVSVEESVPPFLRGQRNHGWVAVEYAMLPSSTEDRSRRERQNISGRTHEIQRFIAKSLRSVVDLRQLGERTLFVDCDVLQADGSTRAASVVGGSMALKMAIEALLRQNRLRTNPLRDQAVALSVGLIDGQVHVDLDYPESQQTSATLHISLSSEGKILESHLSSEKASCSREELASMIDAAVAASQDIFDEQNAALG